MTGIESARRGSEPASIVLGSADCSVSAVHIPRGGLVLRTHINRRTALGLGAGGPRGS